MKLSELSLKQIQRARVIFNAAAPFGADAVAGALMTAAAESSYKLYANDGTTKRVDVPVSIKIKVRESLQYDHDAVAPQVEAWRPVGYWDTTADSMGHFQQRLMYNYGTIADLMDPEESTRIFLRGSKIAKTKCFLDAPKELTLPQRCQWAQGSEYPSGENYEKEAVVTAQLISLFVREADWLDMANKEEVREAFLEALQSFKAELVEAIHDDIVGILRAPEFELSKSKIAKAVHEWQITSAVNGHDYPFSAIVGWTDMHTSNIEAAAKFLIEQAGGELVPDPNHPGNFTYRKKSE